MSAWISGRRRPVAATAFAITAFAIAAFAIEVSGQTGADGRSTRPPLVVSEFPKVLNTDLQKIRVSVVASGLSHPWGMVFLPGGDLLLTERPGRVRLVRNGRLLPDPVPGGPVVRTDCRLAGLNDIALHPRFAENKLVYLSYQKPREDGASASAVARARLVDDRLTALEDIFVANDWVQSCNDFGGRIVFDRAGFLYFTIGIRSLTVEERPEFFRKVAWSQDLASHRGKVLRLKDDGTAPPDNPFVGQANTRPEIFTRGHRSPQGLAVHPVTGELWATEHGPTGGDELNLLRPGGNYGWPLTSFGVTAPDSKRLNLEPLPPNLIEPIAFWVPSIGASGLMFYTGDRFPKWKGNAFVGAMGRDGGGTSFALHIHRFAFPPNGSPYPSGREAILRELGQRIRDIKQGPDGLLYVLTEEDNSALLKLEPVEN